MPMLPPERTLRRIQASGAVGSLISVFAGLVSSPVGCVIAVCAASGSGAATPRINNQAFQRSVDT